MFKQYTTAERRIREKQREERFTVVLRISCGLISLLIIAGFIYFFTNGGLEELKINQDLRKHAPKLALAILGILTMTGVYAVRGDKSIESIRSMFRGYR